MTFSASPNAGSSSECGELPAMELAPPKLTWVTIECRTSGTLDKVDGLTRSTEVLSEVVLTIPDTIQPEKARRLVEKAEQTCFIANSLNVDKRLSCEL